MRQTLAIKTRKSPELRKSPVPESRIEPETPFTPATFSAKSNYSPDVMGAMCDAVFLAFQLPEAPEDLEKELDEVSCAWLRLRRASQFLQQQPQGPPAFPGKMWTPEAKPPSSADLEVLDTFCKYIMKYNPSLEDTWSTMSIRTGSLTVFALRNGLGFLGTSEDTSIERSGAVWPKDLPSAEKMFSILCCLLRVSGDEIPKDKFVCLKRWIDTENVINDFVQAKEIEQILVADLSGMRLKHIVAKNRPNTTEDILKLMEVIEMLLELEPKASAQLLLDEGGGLLPVVIDMVLAQGLVCIENKTVLVLWNFCQTLLDRVTGLGYQRPKSFSPIKELGLTTLTNATMASLAASGNRSEQPLSSPKRGSSKEHASATSPTLLPPISKDRSSSASNSPKEPAPLPSGKFDVYLPDKELSSRPSTPSRSKSKARQGSPPVNETSKTASRPSTPSGPRPTTPGARRPSLATKDLPVVPLALDNKAGAKSVKRRPGLTQKSKTISEGTDSHNPLDRFRGAVRKKSIGNLSARGEEKPSAPAPKKRSLVRRKSVCCSSSELDTLVQPPTCDVSRDEWELQCCKMIWAFMPPQSITYAIGAGLHSVGSRKFRGKLLRAAWQMLDKARAVECSVGIIGTTRLRLEMDLMADQFIRSLHFGEDADAEELKQFCNKVRLTMVHLQTVCEADERLAQVAVLYGVAFVAECLCKWADEIDGGASLALACRSLLRIMNKYLIQLFQRRIVPEESKLDLAESDEEDGDKPRSSDSTCIPPSDDAGRSEIC